MIKKLLTIVLAALCLNYSNKAFAQTPTNKAVDITSTGLQIGQKIPDIPSLSKYKGKLIILDFWATWCSPCVAMLPKMEALQEQFKDQIQIIPVTYQPENKALPFLKKIRKGKPSVLPHITGETQLHKLFPHIYLPHYVWIDKRGIVKAITGSEEISGENILKMLAGPSHLNQKRDMHLTHDKTKPLLLNGNGGNGSNMIYHSVLTTYTEGLGSGASQKIDETLNYAKIILTNMSISWFFKIAYSEGTARFHDEKNIVYNLADFSKIRNPHKGDPEFTQWAKNGNAYCYELIVPYNLREGLYNVMKEDLKRLFGQYVARIEQRNTDVLVISDKTKSN